MSHSFLCHAELEILKKSRVLRWVVTYLLYFFSHRELPRSFFHWSPASFVFFPDCRCDTEELRQALVAIMLGKKADVGGGQMNDAILIFSLWSNIWRADWFVDSCCAHQHLWTPLDIGLKLTRCLDGLWSWTVVRGCFVPTAWHPAPTGWEELLFITTFTSYLTALLHLPHDGKMALDVNDLYM